MTSSKQQEKQDNENYSKNFTRVPNIVFVSYRHLTKEEKFLYCTLRQVYWDMKPRFVTLRELSAMTGYSVSALCKMVPHLHICDLIHAEVRKEKGKDGKEKGNPKYHITIPDIWELNKRYFEASPEEQAKIDPSLKLVHENEQDLLKPVHEKVQPCSPNNTRLFTKTNKVVAFGEQVQAQVERTKDNNKDTLKEREKDSVAPAVAQEHPTSLQQDVLSPSLSLKKNDSSFSPSPEEKPTPVDYALFDRLCRAKGYAADFRVPRNDKNNEAIKELREQGANAEQVEYVFNDIWDDKDPFWKQHRGKPSTVASQFTARVWKMTQPTPKRRTVSGFANWTEDKKMGVPETKPVETTPAKAEVKPVEVTPVSVPAKPKEPALPVGYTRLKIDRPVRARSAYGRRLQEEKEALEMSGNDFRKEL